MYLFVSFLWMWYPYFEVVAKRHVVDLNSLLYWLKWRWWIFKNFFCCGLKVFLASFKIVDRIIFRTATNNLFSIRKKTKENFESNVCLYSSMIEWSMSDKSISRNLDLYNLLNRISSKSRFTFFTWGFAYLRKRL